MIHAFTFPAFAAETILLHFRKAGVCVMGLAALLAPGCAAPAVMRMEAQRYRIDVRLDPLSHRIQGQVAMDLARVEGGQDLGAGPVAIELQLHPDLAITDLHGGGVRAALIPSAMPMPPSAVTEVGIEPHKSPIKSAPRSHWVRVDRPVESMTLFVSFEGKLFQDVAAGEKPGEIHNFQMQAHIGEEGIYLADGYWYPQPALVAGAVPPLAHFTLLATKVPDMVLVASGDEDDELGEQSGKQAWRSPYPIPRMVLVGGRHGVQKATHNGVEIAVHLKLANAGQSENLIAAVKKNLDRYVPLMGPYPARQYTVVENFFSSGFAFTCFTLLSSAVIGMGERGWGRHGYLDHEFLHSWWGAGVHVDPRDGNWCESLASYGANYYGFVLDGDEEGARKKRRNICHFLSRIKDEDDKPLGTYGLPGGCSRTIAYDKGAMVFHMLERRMGAERFWTALRQFNEGNLGRYASWADLEWSFENQGLLERRCYNEIECLNDSTFHFPDFFDQWIRREGAPTIILESAENHGFGIMFHIKQSPAFQINDLIVRTMNIETLRSDEPERWDKQFVITGERESLHYHARFCVWPISAELDPDYHTLRKIPPQMILPTTASTRSGKSFTAVMPTGEVPGQLLKLSEVFGSSYKADERIAKTAGQIKPEEDLAERCILILGDAARDPVVNAFLAAIDIPLRWVDNGFAFEDQPFTEPGHAVLCTARHPGVPGGGVTVVYGNTAEAIPRAELIPFYENSLVVFKDGVPILRRDFEPRNVIKVRNTDEP